MTYTWPTRAEWQASAEHYIRSYCTERERVRAAAKHWLSPADLADARDTARQLAAALRRTLTRTINTYGPQFPDEPARGVDRFGWEDALDEARHADYEHLDGVRQDRLQIGRDARAFHEPRLTITHAESVGRRFARIGGDWGTSDTVADLDRLTQLLAAMTERCDAAAREATEDEVQDEIAKRNSDDGWAKELQRRERIDQSRTSPIFH